MTDQGLPGTQVGARWRSGFPTVATSGISWVRGAKWKAYRGMLAVATLKGSRVIFMRFNSAGAYVGSRTPPALSRYGRRALHHQPLQRRPPRHHVQRRQPRRDPVGPPPHLTQGWTTAG